MSKDIIIDDSFSNVIIKFDKLLAERKPKSKGLTPDQKKLHWENYAKTTERQEEVFKKVFDSVFNEQKKEILSRYTDWGVLPASLDDTKTAQKFQPAIELVYHSAFESAV